MLLLTLWPGFFAGCFTLFFFLMLIAFDNPNSSFATGFSALMVPASLIFPVGLLFTIIEAVILMGLFCAHAWRHKSSEDRSFGHIIWILCILLFPFLSLPLYWLLEVRPLEMREI